MPICQHNFAKGFGHRSLAKRNPGASAQEGGFHRIDGSITIVFGSIGKVLSGQGVNPGTSTLRKPKVKLPATIFGFF
jgi:hypothetical protein